MRVTRKLLSWNLVLTDVMLSQCIGVVVAGVSCRSPRSGRDMVVMARRTRFYIGDRLVYMCRRNLVPVSDPVLTCTSTGQWDKLPRCQGLTDSRTVLAPPLGGEGVGARISEGASHQK